MGVEVGANTKYVQPKCPRGLRQSQFVQCCGCEIREYGQQKYRCVQCGGSSISERSKRRTQVVECKGGSICEHNNRRSNCAEFGGCNLCDHVILKYQCSKCKSTAFVSIINAYHNVLSVKCKGSSICEPYKHRSQCTDCKGCSFVNHNKVKYRCPDCNGYQICKASREPYYSGSRTLGHRRLYMFCIHVFTKLSPMILAH